MGTNLLPQIRRLKIFIGNKNEFSNLKTFCKSYTSFLKTIYFSGIEIQKLMLLESRNYLKTFEL